MDKEHEEKIAALHLKYDKKKTPETPQNNEGLAQVDTQVNTMVDTLAEQGQKMGERSKEDNASKSMYF